MSRSCNFIDGQIKKYLIVDDFVCSGNTLRHIHQVIKKYSENRDNEPPRCVGAYLYDQTSKSYISDPDIRIFPQSVN